MNRFSWPGLFKESKRRFKEEDNIEVESDFDDNWNELLKFIKDKGVDGWICTMTTNGLNAIFNNVKFIKLSTTLQLKAGKEIINISKEGIENYEKSKTKSNSDVITITLKRNKDLQIQLIKS